MKCICKCTTDNKRLVSCYKVCTTDTCIFCDICNIDTVCHRRCCIDSHSLCISCTDITCNIYDAHLCIIITLCKRSACIVITPCCTGYRRLNPCCTAIKAYLNELICTKYIYQCTTDNKRLIVGYEVCITNTCIFRDISDIDAICHRRCCIDNCTIISLFTIITCHIGHPNFGSKLTLTRIRHLKRHIA